MLFILGLSSQLFGSIQRLIPFCSASTLLSPNKSKANNYQVFIRSFSSGFRWITRTNEHTWLFLHHNRSRFFPLIPFPKDVYSRWLLLKIFQYFKGQSQAKDMAPWSEDLVGCISWNIEMPRHRTSSWLIFSQFRRGHLYLSDICRRGSWFSMMLGWIAGLRWGDWGFIEGI